MKLTSLPRQLSGLVALFVGTLLLVFGALAWLMFQSQQEGARLTRRVLEQAENSLVLLEEINANQSALQALIRTKDPDELEQGLKQLPVSEQALETHLAPIVAADPALATKLRDLHLTRQAIVADLLHGQQSAAQEKLMLVANPQSEALAALLRLREEGARKQVQAEIAAQSLQARRRLAWQGGALASVLGLLLAFSWRTRSRIVGQIGAIVTGLRSASEELNLAAGQVTGGSHTVADGASVQAASLEQTSASLEELTSMTRRNADNARSAKTLADEAKSAANTGVADMRNLTQAMSAMKQAGSDVSKIIKTIDEIAFQTNILALNAAVEAARAGEAGMGFAVVAEEVRRLAQRSADAARETADKISHAVTMSAQGADLSDTVAGSLKAIADKVGQVNELIAQIAAASTEQSTGLNQINMVVTQMDRVTQTNAASAEESASAAEELNSHANALRNSVEQLQQLVALPHSSTTAGTNPADHGAKSAARALPLPCHRAGSVTLKRAGVPAMKPGR